MNTDHIAKEQKSVLCIGISVLDIIARPVGAPDTWKEKQRIDSVRLLPGGDAANQSIHLASLGYHAMFSGCVGDDANGKTVRSALEARGVDTGLMRFREDTATGTALLLVASDGERHIFSVHGAHSTLCRHDLPSQLPDGCVAISLGSLYGMPLAEEDGLADLLETAGQKNIPVFADLDSGRVTCMPERLLKLLPMIDYLLPSSYDLIPMTGKGTVREAAEYLRDMGVGHVIVKCGREGAVIYEGDGEVHIPAVPVTPLDTTGAGDCMSAAFIARIMEGDTTIDACRYACAAGSFNTLFPGANTVRLTDEKIREFMQESL